MQAAIRTLPGATFPMGTANVTLTAVWNITQYTLTITNGGNGTTNPSGARVVSYGVPTAISAAPATLYYFINWTVASGSGVTFGSTGSSTGTSPNDTVLLTGGNPTIQANFSVLGSMSRRREMTHPQGQQPHLSGQSRGPSAQRGRADRPSTSARVHLRGDRRGIPPLHSRRGQPDRRRGNQGKPDKHPRR